MTRNRTYWLCCTALVGLAVVGSGPLAQAEEVEDLGVITITGNYNGDRFAEAADRNTSIYISEEAIERAEAGGDLRDLFADESSVTVGGGIPIAQKLYVNGLDMINLNVTIDGTMQNNRAFHHVTANAIDPGLLKVVRVDAGIAAADSGPNAVAGSVAFETKDALDLLKDDKNFGARAMLSAESNGATFTESVSGYGRVGNFDFLGYFKNSMGDDYKTGGGWTIDGTGADYQSLLAKLGYSSDDGGRFEASAQILIDDAKRPSRANFGWLAKDPNVTVYDTRRESYSFNYFTEAPEGFWDPEVVLGYSASTIKKPVPYGSNGKSDTLNAKLANTFHFNDDYRVTVGGDAYHKTSKYTDPTSDLSEEVSNFGLFAQARMEPVERLKLSFGGRFDSQTFKGVNGQELDNSGFSGNASASFEIVEDVTLNAGYSNIFAGVDLSDNYLFGRYKAAGAYSSLKAGRSQNMTAGFEIRKMNFIFSGDVFRTEVDDARHQLANADFSSEGFNLGLAYLWQSGQAKVTYSNSKLKRNGRDTDTYNALYVGTPVGETVAFNIRHRFDAYNVTIGGQVDAALDLSNNGQYSTKDFEGYTVASAFLEYEPEQLEGLSLRFDVKNLFDEDYADRSTYGGDFAGTSFRPQSEPGRSFLATVRYEF